MLQTPTPTKWFLAIYDLHHGTISGEYIFATRCLKQVRDSGSAKARLDEKRPSIRQSIVDVETPEVSSPDHATEDSMLFLVVIRIN